MRAAIYARKSTDQSGVVDAERSVTRQVEHALAYATAKGWSVLPEHVFMDDGVSGAEFATRPGFLRLMNAIKPKAPFQALVMSEESRLGREAIETAYALKQLVTSGVRVFFYLEDRERTLDSPLDKVMLSLTAYADELERERARQRTHDALSRKARAGHVTGGRVFGYDNVPVLDHDALGTERRVRVERQVNEGEAAVIRRIYERYAAGDGLSRIAKDLNEDGAPCPRSQQGRPQGWAPSSVREVLHRPLYRGLIVWNQSRKRDQWGIMRQAPRPRSEWLEVPAPELKIIDEGLALAVGARMRDAELRYLTINGGRRGGRPPASGTKYLLAGLLRCSKCGSSLEARSRQHGRTRRVFYGCAGFHRRGAAVCGNRTTIAQAHLEAAVLDAVRSAVLNAEVVEQAVERAVVLLTSEGGEAGQQPVQQQLDHVEAEMRRLTQAIAGGGDLPSLVEALREREARRAALQRQAQRATVGALRRSRRSVPALRATLKARLREWQGLLQAHVAEGQRALKALIQGRLDCEPQPDGGYVFRGTGSIWPVIEGVVPQNVASPAGIEPAFQP